MREKKAAAELEQMILKEVRNLPACQGLTGIRVGPVETTWRVNVYEGEPARPAECMDAISPSCTGCAAFTISRRTIKACAPAPPT
jgi:hypothetical protein